jgi:protein nanos 1
MPNIDTDEASISRNENEISNTYEYDDDEVFSGNGCSIMNDKVPTPNNNNNTDPQIALAYYKKLLAVSNYNNNINNNGKYNECIENINDFNNNSIQSPISAFDNKTRHQSLFSNSKLLSNIQCFQKNDNSINSFQNFQNETKKRANSFGMNMLSPLSSYPVFPNNCGLNNSNSMQNNNSSYRLGNINNNSSFLTNGSQQMRSFSNNNNNNNTSSSSSIMSNEFTMPNSFSSMQGGLSPNEINSSNNKPLRSERLPVQFVDDIIKQAKLRRKNGGKKEVCVFCRNNGEKEQIYTSHTLKDAANRVSCPILRLYQCPICHATADNAHTIKYCQFAEKENGSIKLFKDSRMNTAVLLMNSIANTSPSSSPSPPIQSLSALAKQQSHLNMNLTKQNHNSLALAQAFNNMALNNKNFSEMNKSSLGILSSSNSNGVKLQ